MGKCFMISTERVGAVGLVGRITGFFRSLLLIEEKDRYKVLFLTLAFMLIIGGYTVVRTLRDVLFVSIVGRMSIPWARLWAIIMLVPGVMIFSKLVDMVKRYQLLYIYSVIYGLGGLLIAFFLQHPTIGLPNTAVDSNRLFGWFIYLFIEGYNPFLISVFWSFVHSISSPEGSKIAYPVMVAGSKIGGMVAALLGCYLLSMPVWGTGLTGHIVAHQVILAVFSIWVLLVPLCIMGLRRMVPASYLHGYEAAYKAEHRSHKGEQESTRGKTSIGESLYSMFAGLIMLFKYPYAMGMFGIVFFWEVINSFVSFARLEVVQDSLSSAATAALLHQDFWIHVGGFLLALLGTRVLVELLGERKSLMLSPLITAILLCYYYSTRSTRSMAVIYVLLRVMHYAFSVPLRERLYTPTVTDIKFKSKLWIDSFGIKFSKGAGALYNMVCLQLAEGARFSFSVTIFGTIIGLWIITAHLMGRAFEYAVTKRKVIGLDRE